MKFLLKIINGAAPVFEKGGRLSAFKPVFEAVENFLFAPADRTLQAPHARDPLDVKRFMSVVIVGLVPVLMSSVCFFGLRIIPMLIVSYAVGGAVEVVFAVIRREEINEGFLVTGMLFPLILPPLTPLWMVGLGAAFGVFVGKELFGGTGRNIFNPALVGRCFLSLAYPAQMAGRYIDADGGRFLEYVSPSGVEAVSGATPLAMAKQGELAGIWNMFTGNTAGSYGETSALAIILGGVFLIMMRVSSWRTVVSILLSSFAAAAVLHNADPQRFAPAIWHLLAGGLLFGAFYMATDPVSGPATNGGKYLYGFLIGAVTVLIRNFTGYVEGVTFAILLGNIFAPLLDELFYLIRFRRLADEG